MFAKLAQVELGCTDLAAAKRFYCDQLELPLVGELDNSIFVRCGDVNLCIQQAPTPKPTRTLYFGADGRIEETTTALKAKGIAFTQEPRRIARDQGGVDVWLGFFQDPFGNSLALLANMPANQ
jgi:catechol 2,3-dioxygenase-like lactoylglutathione lyase family enzyme